MDAQEKIIEIIERIQQEIEESILDSEDVEMQELKLGIFEETVNDFLYEFHKEVDALEIIEENVEEHT